VKVDLSETSREFRQASFVLYNCARLAKLFQNFEENVHKGEKKHFINSKSVIKHKNTWFQYDILNPIT